MLDWLLDAFLGLFGNSFSMPSWLESFFETILGILQEGITSFNQILQTMLNIVTFIYVYLPNLMPPAFYPMTIIFLSYISIIIALKIAKTILDAIPLL
jgi:hypothetical protein